MNATEISIDREKAIQRIREEIGKTRISKWELPKWAEDVLKEERQDELQGYVADVEAEALEWVLREIFEVTP